MENNIVYQIADGRLYDVEQKCFVTEADPDKELVVLYQSGKPAREDYLKSTLEFYGWPVGVELLTLEEAQTSKLNELNDGLIAARADATASIMSSVGFEINANTTAKENIDSLITLLEFTGDEATSFMAFDNTMKSVTLDELKTMQLELVAWGQALYAYKWATRSQIEAAEDAATVMAIEIDYSQASVFFASLKPSFEASE